MGKKYNVPGPVASLSSVGKMCDATSRDRPSGLHHGKKTRLEPWDGVELIERIMDEARGTRGPRGVALLSSPRINPALLLQAESEASIQRTESFMTTVANFVDLTPAVKVNAVAKKKRASGFRKMSPRRAVDSPPRRVRSATVRPSSSFKAPPRPPPGNTTAAPSVGQYIPKYTAVERHSASYVISRPASAAMKDAHGMSDEMAGDDAPVEVKSSPIVSASATPAAAGSALNVPRGRVMRPHTASLDATRISSNANRTARSPTPTESDRPARTDVSVVSNHRGTRDVSSVFKSSTQRSAFRQMTDVDYWPYPDKGKAGSHCIDMQRSIHTSKSIKPRERPSTASANPTAKALRPPISFRMDSMPSREEQKVHGVGMYDQGSAQYPAFHNVYRAAETTDKVRPRSACLVSMAKAPGRPSSALDKAAETHDKENNKEGNASTGKSSPHRTASAGLHAKGFVDMSRMTTYEHRKNTEELDLLNLRKDPNTREELHVNRAPIERRSPTPDFGAQGAGHAESSVFAASRAHAPTYDVSYAGVDRHRPFCAFDHGEPTVPRAVSPNQAEAAHRAANASRHQHQTLNLNLNATDASAASMGPSMVARTSSPLRVAKSPRQDMALQLSRDQREKRHKQQEVTDEIYDVKPPKPRSVVPFSIMQGRKF